MTPRNRLKRRVRWAWSKKPDLRGDVGQWLAVEDPVARDLEATRHDVGVRRDPERRLEAPGEMGRAGTEQLGRRRHRHGLEQVQIQVRAEGLDRRVGFVSVPPHLIGGRHPAHGLADPLRDQMESRLGLECVIDTSQRIVERRHRVSQRDVRQRRPVHRRPDERLADDRRLDVDDAFAVAVGVDRSAVVDDVGRKDRHDGRLGALRPPIEVVADRALVDQEHASRRRGCGPGRRARHGGREGPRGRPGPAASRRGRCRATRPGPMVTAGSYKTVRRVACLRSRRGMACRFARVRVRVHGHTRPEQHPAVGVGRGVRIASVLAACARHGARRRAAGHPGRGRPGRLDHLGPVARPGDEGRRVDLPPLPCLAGRGRGRASSGRLRLGR